MRTTIQNVSILPGVSREDNGLMPVIPNGCVQISGGRFCFVGPSINAPDFQADETVDGKGMLLMPALCNAHTHNAMTLLRGIGSDLPLRKWLYDEIFPRESRLTAGLVRAGVRLALLEHLRCGVTTFNDMYMFIRDEAEIVAQSGMRALLCDACVDFGNGDRQLADALSFYREYQGAADGRIRTSVSVHAEYTSNPAFVRKVADAAAPLNNTVHVHVSETQHEVEECVSRHGVTPVRYFHDIGLFLMPVVAAHCVAVSDEDIAILASDRVAVAHCPVSNLKLGSGIAPIPRMLDAGVRVTLGTDGAASNNNLNLWEEIKLTGILHKGTSADPCAVSPAQALSAAVNGPESLGFSGLGEIREGMLADLILVDLNTPHMVPCRDLGAGLVYGAAESDIRLTMAEGRVLYRDGVYTTLDAEKIIREAQNAAEALA